MGNSVLPCQIGDLGDTATTKNQLSMPTVQFQKSGVAMGCKYNTCYWLFTARLLNVERDLPLIDSVPQKRLLCSIVSDDQYEPQRYHSGAKETRSICLITKVANWGCGSVSKMLA